MARKSYAYIRVERRKWGITQVELARLLGFLSRSAVSRLERAERTPTMATVIACALIFGLDAPALFPSLHDEVEEAVASSARLLHAELVDLSDKASVRKRVLLEQILERINRHKQI